MQGYNLVVSLRLQNISADEAIAKLQKQLAGTVISVPVQLRTEAAVRALAALNQEAQKGVTLNASLAQSANRASASQRHVSQAFADTARELANARRNASTFVRDIATLTAGVFSLHKGLVTLQAGLRELQEFQGKQVAFGQVVGSSIYSPQTAGISKQVRNAAKQYGVSSTELMGQSVTLAQADFRPEEVSSLVNTLAKLRLNAQVQDVNRLSNSIIILKSAFRQSTPEIEASLSSMIAVSKAYAVELEDLQQVLTKTGGVMRSTGGNIHHVNALATVLRQSTRMSGAQAGTALKSIIARTVSGGDSTQAIEGLGVKVFSDNGKQRDLLAVYTELARALGNLNDAERNAIALKIAGVHHLSSFLAIMQNIGLANAVYAKSLSSTNQIERDAAIAQESLANQLTKVREAWYGVVGGFAENKAIQQTTREILQLTAALAEMAPVLLTIGAAHGGSLLAGRLTKSPMTGLLPQTTLATGRNRWERAGAMRAMGYNVQAEHPVLRQGRAMLGNVAANLWENRQLVAGGLALGGLAVANRIEPTSYGNAAGKASFEGASAGLMAFALGLNPATAAVVGLGTAVVTLSGTLEEADASIRDRVIGQAEGRTKQAVERFGFADPRTLRALADQITTAKEQQKQAFREPGTGETFLRAASNILTLNWGSVGSEMTDLQQGRIQGFQQSVASFTEVVDKGMRDFVGSGASLKDWGTWNRGVMLKLGELYDIADDGVANGSRSLQETVAQQLKERDSRRQIAANMEQAEAAARREADYRKELAERANALAQAYGQAGKVADSRRAVALSGLELQAQAASFAGRPVRQGEAYNAVAQQQAATLGGSADVGALSTKLAQLVDLQSKNVGGTGELLNPIIDNTANALRVLADASLRTRGYFEELNQATAALNAKYGLAESFFSSDKQGRQGMIADQQAARRLLASGGDLNRLSIEDQQSALRHFNRTANIRGATAGEAYTGEQLKQAVLEKTLGGGVFAPEKTAKADAESKILGVMQQAQQAQVALMQFEQQRQAQFFGQLTEINRSFLQNLGNIWGVKNVVPQQQVALAPPVVPQPLPLPANPQAAAPQAQTGVDLQRLATQALGGRGSIDAVLNPANVGREQPLKGLDWSQLPVQPVEDLTEQRARNRSAYLLDRINRGAKPERFGGFASQIGFNSAGFHSQNIEKLEQALRLRSKGYTGDEVNALGRAGVDFGLTEGNKRLAENAGRLEAALNGKALPQAVAQFGNHVAKFEAAAQAMRGNAEQREAAHQGNTLPAKAVPGSDLKPTADHVATLGRQFDGFGGHVATLGLHFSRFENAVARIPTEISLAGKHEVNVVITGAEALVQLEPSIRGLVSRLVGEAIDSYNRRLREFGPGIA